jgi:ferredoxin
MMLDDEQTGKGYALLCVAYAKSDLEIQTHTEGELY